MTKPIINISQAPQTPRDEGKPERSRNHLTPSYSFGLGFSPSFQFNSPRNINLLSSLSPQRFFQVSNNLHRVVGTKKEEKNIFNSSTPSKNNSKFLDTISSLNEKPDSEESMISNEDSGLFSINESNSSFQATPQPATSREQEEFLTPKKLAKPIIKKRKVSVSLTESPNSTIASKIETIASPPRSIRSSSIHSLHEDKSWTSNLDDVLLSSYLKFKAFKNNNNKSSILKDVSQNKVISRMLYNKTKVLKSPKQISTRLFQLTKDHSEPLNNEIDELIQTPLEDLISKQYSINTAEIDRELDLIFSPDFHNPFNIIEFEITYQSTDKSKQFYFVRLDKVNLSPELKSIETLSRDGNLQQSNEIHRNLLTKFENNDIAIYQVTNNLDLNMKSLNDFTTLDSVISHANPFDLEKGDINSYIKVLVDNDSPTINWSCNTNIYRNSDLIFESNDPVFGILNKTLNKVEVTIPFIKSFWRGFLSLLMNGNENLSREIKIVQIVSSDQPELCFIHQFNDSVEPGKCKFQVTQSTDFFGDDLRVILEEKSEPQTQDDTDDNETVLADSSPLAPSPKRQFQIDLSSARSLPFNDNGPSTAPIFNSKVISQAQYNREQLGMSHQSHSAVNIPTFNYNNDKINSPGVISPFNTSQYDLNNKSSTPNSSIMTSTPARTFTHSNDVYNQQFVPNQGQLMVNLGNGFVPFNSLPPHVQQRYTEFQQQQQRLQQQQRQQPQQQQHHQHQQPQQQYQHPQQQQHIQQQIQNQFQQQMHQQIQQQQMQRMMYSQPQMNYLGTQQNHPGILQNIPMNYTNINSAPASQTSFNIKKSNKENQKPIKFGPMLEYDPSRSNNITKVKERKVTKPGVSVLHIPRESPVYIYKPPKRKSSGGSS